MADLSLPSASSDHVSSVFSLEGRLYGFPLRVSYEGLLRPRVAQAHSYRAHSASRRTARLPVQSYCRIAESTHFPSWDRMKVQASPDSVGVSSLPSTT